MRQEILTAWADGNGVCLTTEMLDKLAAYQAHVLDVNKQMNLTAITDPTDFAVKHYIDSFTLLPWIKPNARLIDVGTGAGFPGVPLKIVRPDISLTLVDSLRKRVHFLQDAVAQLGMTEVVCLHARAEEYAKKLTVDKLYDVCTVRAVARMSVLVGYALPLLRPGGLLLAMKGLDIAGEMQEAEKALKKYGGKVTQIKPVEIATGLWHTVVVVEKVHNGALSR